MAECPTGEETGGARAHASPPARLIGRDGPLSQLVTLLADGVRLVEVCGPAGVGRSALVRAAVATARRHYDGVHWLDLSDPATADPWLARLVRGPGAGPAGEAETGWDVAPAGRVLVVLDRLDARSRDSWAPGPLLQHPGVQIVAITRGRAGVVGAKVEVPPLDAASAQQLFVERAAASDPSFVLDAGSTEHVRSICAALDGLPLALELAAARLSALPLAMLARRLTQRHALGLLSDAGRAGGGMRASLEASCDLLPPSACALLHAAAAFRGSFSLEALLEVSGRPPTGVYDDLTTLVDLRLVDSDAADGGAGRYRLPGLVRELASEQLDGSGRRDELCARLARVYVEIARRTAAQLDDARDEQALPVLQQEGLELWAALEWSVEHDQASAAVLATALSPVADHLGRNEALLDVLNRLGAGGVGSNLAARRDLLLAAGVQGTLSRAGVADVELATRRLREAIDLARTVGEPRALLRCLAATVRALPATGDLDGVTVAAKEGIELSRAIGHARWRARFEAWTGMVLHLARDYAGAARYGNEALTRALRAGDPRGVVIAGLLLHPLPADAGVNRSCLPSLEELLAMAAAMNDPTSQLWLLAQLGGFALVAGDAPVTARWALRRLDLSQRSGAWHSAGVVLMLTAGVASLRHDDGIAADLHGAVGPMLDVMVRAMPPSFARAYETRIDEARGRLGAAVFDRRAADAGNPTWKETLAGAHAYLSTACETLAPSSHVGAPQRRGSAAELTPRELQVLTLLAQGCRNKEIALALHITPKSVMHHSVAIYRKLGVRGRAEAAVQALQQGLVPVS